MSLPRALIILAIASLSLVTPGRAHAYPWMIRHDYTGCAQCHVDPSGSGPLTAYGRAMGEVLLRAQYGTHAVGEPPDPGRTGNFLWGAVPLPEWLDFGGNFREMLLAQKVGEDLLESRLVNMQQDLSATVSAGRFVASGSLGYAPRGGLTAAITRGVQDNIVSREHWAGFRLDEGATMLVRAGRMNLPFGIRDIFHTLTIRSATRTDTNEQQQHGLAFSYSGEAFRAELMAIFGNFQLTPHEYRERGYSGYVEWAPATHVAIGASSRIAHVSLDERSLQPMWRHAHGVFGRWATPFRPLVLLAEADYAIDSPEGLPRDQGMLAMAQADFEIVQGVHYQMMGEMWDFGPHGSGLSESVWASFAWFFASHADLRLDGIVQSRWGPPPTGRTPATFLLAQAHLYL